MAREYFYLNHIKIDLTWINNNSTPMKLGYLLDTLAELQRNLTQQLSHITQKRVFGDFWPGKLQTSLLSFRS